MKKHYHTSENTILCKQKNKQGILSDARFSYKIGNSNNCKNCEKILRIHASETNNICTSLAELGYSTECQWREETKCNCIDDCRFKRAVANVL